MKDQKAKGEGNGANTSAIVRSSISFPRNLYNTLEAIARQKKVLLTWVVRDAAEQYIADKFPLFKGQP